MIILDILICEDNHNQRAQLENIIKCQLERLSLDYKIVLSAGTTEEVEKYLAKSDNSQRIYFLDVELDQEESGLKLGSIIRKYDENGYIIFVSSHVEKPLLTFQYKLQALDFIFKFDINIADRVGECLEVIGEKVGRLQCKNHSKFTVNTGGRIYNFYYDEILFFETTGKSHRIKIHTKNNQIEFSGTMKSLAENVSADFYKVHKSYLVNIKNIKEVDKKALLIKMVNGEKVYVSRLYMKGLIDLCKC